MILVLLLSLRWISIEQANNFDILLKVIYLISCLTIYLSYINQNQHLTFIGRFLKEGLVGKGYRIQNQKILEELGLVDLVIIQDNCLESGKQELLTKINSFLELKLIS